MMRVSRLFLSLVLAAELIKPINTYAAPSSIPKLDLRGSGRTTIHTNTTSDHELLANPSFSDGAGGWFLRNAVPLPPDSHNSGQMVLPNGVVPGPESWSHVGVQLQSIPCNHKLNFSCALRSQTQGQKVMVNAFAYNSAKKLVANWTEESTLNKDTWKRFGTTYVVPTGCTTLAIWVVNKTEQPAYVSKASLILGKEELAKQSRPSFDALHSDPLATKVILAKYKTCVRAAKEGDTGIVTFPIPGLYRERIPLTFDVSTEPPSALINTRIRTREDGLNLICEVTVQPPPAGVIVRWQALVLVCGRKEPSLPKSKISASNEVAAWTKSTTCVQSADQAIRAKSEELANGSLDVEAYARKVIAFTSTNRGTGALFNALDAKRALECGGSCTSRANLAAALLRARGIPARTMSHLPAWYSGRLYEHWLVEYWHPGVGWVWIESTLGQFQPAPNTLVVLAVSNPDDENKALDPIHLRGIMPGAAYLSGCEFSKELMAADLTDMSANTAVIQGEIQGSKTEMDSLLSAARQSYKRHGETVLDQHGRSRADAVRLAAEKGKATGLSTVLQSD